MGNPLIKAWYYNLKQVTCPACEVNGATGDKNIELHHLDRSTKCDTVSNLVYHNAPPILIMDELFKVIPLCRKHHVDFHKNEKYLEYTKKRYNFAEDDIYKTALINFQANVWLTAPNMVKNAYIMR